MTLATRKLKLDTIDINNKLTKPNVITFTFALIAMVNIKETIKLISSRNKKCRINLA
ncbi:hypothetical protein GsuE55_23050 [Geobacillus subterraneus]|uniref:Uncharacterized protein n=1 Tax=Geobacillus subterraneus TaxID=129338 RepID=A0A679FLM0_9BACL|nr:hypothetical protein GsuE55_23050 [Geobacillus subterraneus]